MRYNWRWWRQVRWEVEEGGSICSGNMDSSFFSASTIFSSGDLVNHLFPSKCFRDDVGRQEEIS